MAVSFFMSSGRCGTQWFADNLASIYADKIIAAHEPLGFEYFSRELNSGVPLDDIKTAGIIKDHLGEIEKIATNLIPGCEQYIETGWVAYGIVPYLMDRFGDQVRIVHLVRNPIHTASSMVTHNYYGFGRSKLLERLLMTPMDNNSRYPELADSWSTMSQFEKCLYFWAELNTIALDTIANFGIPSIRIKFEDVFSNDRTALKELLQFLELPERDGLFSNCGIKVDKFFAKTDSRWDLAAFEKYPQFQALARELGYEAHQMDPDEIERRYWTADGEAGNWIRDEENPPPPKRNDPCFCGSGKRYKNCHGQNAAN